MLLGDRKRLEGVGVFCEKVTLGSTCTFFVILAVPLFGSSFSLIAPLDWAFKAQLCNEDLAKTVTHQLDLHLLHRWVSGVGLASRSQMVHPFRHSSLSQSLGVQCSPYACSRALDSVPDMDAAP